MFDGAFFILGVIPGTALILAVIIGLASRKRAGRPRWLVYLLALFLFVPVLLVEWLLVTPLGPTLAETSPVVGDVIVPALMVVIGGFLSYRFALNISRAGTD